MEATNPEIWCYSELRHGLTYYQGRSPTRIQEKAEEPVF